jgi:hypothetical protein
MSRAFISKIMQVVIIIALLQFTKCKISVLGMEYLSANLLVHGQLNL